MAKTPFELAGKRVFVAGHRGMVGAALVRRLEAENIQLLTAGRNQLDLRDQAAVFGWFEANRPEVIFLAAAKVGGIVANNTFCAEFLYENLAIVANVIHAAYLTRAHLDLRKNSLLEAAEADVACVSELAADAARAPSDRGDCDDRRLRKTVHEINPREQPVCPRGYEGLQTRSCAEMQ